MQAMACSAKENEQPNTSPSSKKNAIRVPALLAELGGTLSGPFIIAEDAKNPFDMAIMTINKIGYKSSSKYGTTPFPVFVVCTLQFRNNGTNTKRRIEQKNVLFEESFT